jgi:ribose transport system permease protein
MSELQAVSVSNDAPPGSAAPAPTPTGSAESGARRDKVLEFVERYALVGMFALTFLFFSVWPKTSGTFPTVATIREVLGDQAVVGILSLAIIIPLVCGEFDFSVGSVAGLSQVLCAGFMSRLGAPLPLAILGAVGVGVLIGLANGNTVARIGVNSLIVTLGIATVLLGVVEWYTKGQSIVLHISKHLTRLGSGNWFGIPRTLYFLVVIAALVYYLLEHTPYGRYLHSIGSNRDAARLVGLRVEWLVLLSFVLSGLLAGLAGVMLVARNGAANPQVGTITETLQALAAAFLGATAIKPGRFNVVGTMVAIFFLAFTVTGLTLAGVADWINNVFNGAALFIAVVISTVVGRKRAGIT